VTEPNWEIQVSDLVAPDKINLPPGGLMQITPPQVRPQGVASFELIIVNGEGEKTRKWINARVSYVTRVAILTRQIEARTRITEADIRWEKKEISQLQDIPAGHGDLLTGVAKFTLTPGMIVTRSQLEREMALRYGEEVEVLAGDDVFAVTSKGIAQQNGFVGDTVKIKSSINNKILDGLVTARGVVHVRY
jgi:flagella basal body P-ring formation protein FlgA